MGIDGRLREGARQHEPEWLRADVHKARDENVWIHATGELDQNPLDVGFELPVRPGQARFADLMEVQRQVGMAQVHRHLGVPHADAFVLNSISLSLDGPTSWSPLATRGRAVSVVEKVRSVKESARSADQRFTISTADGRTAHGTSTATFLPRAVYERLRSSTPRSAVASSSDLPQSPVAWTLPLASDDPLLTDHRSDHVSAMAIVCGVERVVTRQLEERRSLLRLSLSFTSYVESAPVPTLSLSWESPHAFSGTILQGDSVRAILTGNLNTHPEQAHE